MNLTLWDTNLRDGNGHTNEEAQNTFYAKINFARTRHVLMQRKLTTNATNVAQVLSGKLWNLIKTQQMMISSKCRKTCITKKRILCSSSNVIYRLLCCCFVVIVIVTVIPIKCLHMLVTAWQMLLLVLLSFLFIIIITMQWFGQDTALQATRSQIDS